MVKFSNPNHSSTFFPIVNPFSSSYNSFNRLGIFIQKRSTWRHKILLLDTVVPNFYYLEEFQKLYGETLGEYLARYLTFLLSQKPKESENASPSCENQDNQDHEEKSLSTSDDTSDDFGSFGGFFLNQEFQEMNDLPNSRETLAKISLYGQNLYLKKINHFFTLFDFFFKCGKTLKIKCQGKCRVSDNPIKDQGANKVYLFSEWPNKTLSYQTNSPAEIGFFDINFKKTFDIGAGSSDYDNFLNILKTSNLILNFNCEELLKEFTQALIDINGRLLELKLNSQESPCVGITLDVLIYYVDCLLNMAKTQLKFQFDYVQQEPVHRSRSKFRAYNKTLLTGPYLPTGPFRKRPSF